MQVFWKYVEIHSQIGKDGRNNYDGDNGISNGWHVRYTKAFGRQGKEKVDQ